MSRRLVLLFSLYFGEGLLYAVVVAMSSVYFKNAGADNSWITFWTGLLALPWTVKGLWAPLVDRALNLARPLLLLQRVSIVLCLALAVMTSMYSARSLVLVVLGLLGFFAASQELIIDAVYLSLWSVEEQSQLMWLRNTAFRVSYLLGAGILVSLAGFVNETSLVQASTMQGGWTLVFGICTLLMAVTSLLTRSCLDGQTGLVTDTKHGSSGKSVNLLEAAAVFVKIPDIWKVVFYVLTFRIGDAFLSSMVQPFLLDPLNKGGLQMKTSTVGLVYGTVGALSLIAGGVVGGVAVSKVGVKRVLIPFSLVQSLSILLYAVLAQNHPGLGYVALANSFEQFAFGLTTSCYSIVLLMAVDLRFRATHFALISAVMNFGLILPAMAAGTVADKLGYFNFFLFSFVVSLTGPVISLSLPRSEYLESIKVDSI